MDADLLDRNAKWPSRRDESRTTPDDLLQNRHLALGDESFRHNSYQWDMVTDDGDFYKGGFGGQGLSVAPSDNLVIAWFGTPDDRGGTEMLRIARQIAESGLF